MLEKRTVVIVTALRVEFEAVRAHISNVQMEGHPEGTIYEVGDFSTARSKWKVGVVEAGPRNAPVAVEAERAIAHFRPSHAFLVGVAGGVKDVRLGDVVAASKVYGYASGKADEEFLPRPDVGRSHFALVHLSKYIRRNLFWINRITPAPEVEPNAFVEPIAAGEAVVSSTRSAIYQFLRHKYSDALAVEMEGIGMLEAGYANPSVQTVVIRGISDLIDKKEEADKTGSQIVASRHAAAFAFELLARIDEQGHEDVMEAIDDVRWDKLAETAAQLYPKGPTDNEIWSRSGGDVSLLNLNLNGRAAWHTALRSLRLGGGGSAICIASLLEAMNSDYHNNEVLRELATQLKMARP